MLRTLLKCTIAGMVFTGASLSAQDRLPADPAKEKYLIFDHGRSTFQPVGKPGVNGRGQWCIAGGWRIDSTMGKGDTWSLTAAHATRQVSECRVVLPSFNQYDEFVFPDYDLSVDVRTEGARGILFLDIVTERPDVKAESFPVPLTGDNNWRRFAFKTKIPECMWRFCLILRYEGEGTIQVDNVVLCPVYNGP